MPRGLFSKKGMAWFAGVELPTEFDTRQRDLLVERLRRTPG
jgi:hypothetical protein